MEKGGIDLDVSVDFAYKYWRGAGMENWKIKEKPWIVIIYMNLSLFSSKNFGVFSWEFLTVPKRGLSGI